VADWIARLPAWVRIEQADVRMIPDHIGIGERAAIELPTRLKADRLLIDDREARALAERVGLRIAGTLAVIVDAARAGLIDPLRVLADLQRTSFRASATLLLEVLSLCQRRPD
jgi:predicted nucleic acid-binding protein